MQEEYFTLESIVNFIANRICTLREAKGVSAYTMSIELGQNNSYINKIENKVSNPSIEGLYNICQYFDITFDEFFNTEVNYPDKMKELLEEAKKLEINTLQILIDIARKFNQK